MEELKNQIVYSVSDFIAVINQTLEYAYPTVLIEGEVASFKVNQNKFIFFDVKDKDGSINCFMTVWQLRMPIEDGMKVIITATPKLTKWGKFSLTVREIRPSGEGALKKSLELLKANLRAEGLFEPDRKRLLPKLPKHIGLISSTGAAGYVDFIKILNDRWGGMKVDVADVQVQGVGAADQIIRAINYFNQREALPEVIVIVRGGGSADDLAVFNDEPLVRAVAGSRVPTLIGVGHEVDESLVDLVADVRAATPSNAAQILVPDKHDLIRAVKTQTGSLLPKVLQVLDKQRQNVRLMMSRSFESVERAIDSELTRILSVKSVISQLDPDRVLARGYAIMRGDPKKGKIIEIETIKAILKAEVKNVTSK